MAVTPFRLFLFLVPVRFHVLRSTELMKHLNMSCSTSKGRRTEEGLIRSCHRVEGVYARVQVVVGIGQVGVAEVGMMGPHQIASAVRVSRTRRHDLRKVGIGIVSPDNRHAG